MEKEYIKEDKTNFYLSLIFKVTPTWFANFKSESKRSKIKKLNYEKLFFIIFGFCKILKI